MTRNSFAVRLLRAAEEDLGEIVSYIAADNPHAAESMVDKMEKGLRALGAHPYLGRVPADAELTRMRYRYVVINDYLVFYTLEGRTVLIHRILHGARNYKGLL